MPVSSYSCIPHILEAIEQVRTGRPDNKKNILDLGAGYGMYGALCRNYFPNSWIVGVEGFAKYQGAMWGCYDMMVSDKIEKYSPRGSYDVILLADVIEHFKKPQGVGILRKAQGWLSDAGVLIVSTPAIWSPQGAVYGNLLEVHRSFWAAEELEIHGFKAIKNSPDLFKHNMIVAIYKNQEEK